MCFSIRYRISRVSFLLSRTSPLLKILPNLTIAMILLVKLRSSSMLEATFSLPITKNSCVWQPQALRARYHNNVTHLSTCVDVFGGIGDGNGTHNFTMTQRVNLSRMPRDAGSYQRVWWKRNRLHLTVSIHVERISPKKRYECIQKLILLYNYVLMKSLYFILVDGRKIDLLK